MSDLTPHPEHLFTFGLWTVGNPGRDPFGEPTRAVVDLSDRRLTVFEGDAPIGTSRVGIGSRGWPKCREGDKRTPVGNYYLSPARKSRYRLFLAIDYPSASDRARSCDGGAVGLHGTGPTLARKALQRSHVDWSTGCITVANRDIDAIARLVRRRIAIGIIA